MKLSLDTPFDQVQTLLDELRKRGLGAVNAGQGRRWRAIFNMVQGYRQAQQRVLHDLQELQIPAPSELLLAAPTGAASGRLGGFVAALLFAGFRRGEAVREKLRHFGVWLSAFIFEVEAVEQANLRDFERLTACVEKCSESFALGARSDFAYEVSAKTLSSSDLEWRLPLSRGSRLAWLSERVRAREIVEIVQKNLLERQQRVLTLASKQLAELVEETNDYVKSLRAYVSVDYDVGSDEFTGVLSERSKLLAQRFRRESDAVLMKSREQAQALFVGVCGNLNSLRSRSWLAIRSALRPKLSQLIAAYWQKVYRQLLRYRDQVERQGNDWIEERIKPALGIVQNVEIATRLLTVPAAWQRAPQLSPVVTDILTDRRNPALLEMPGDVLRMVKQLRQQFELGNRCGGLLLTDNFCGGFSMMAHALSIYFRDEPYRIFRRQQTRPLKGLPRFEEQVVFIENLERLIILDSEHLQQAAELITSLVETDKMHVVAVHYRIAERLRLAAPVLARFAVEVRLVRYSAAVFAAIMRKRMAVAGVSLRFRNENAFWADLYRSASGLPGVGLDIFMRCLRQTGDAEFLAEFNLPPLRSLFDGLDNQRLLLLRRLYEQPFLVADYFETRERPLLNSLVDSGIVIDQDGAFALHRPFYGVLRDVLKTKNLL